MVHIVPPPPAIVAEPVPVSNSLCPTTAPPSPKSRSLTPPIKRTLVVASSRTVRFGIEYPLVVAASCCPDAGGGLLGSAGTFRTDGAARRIFSTIATSSHAPQTVYTGTLSLSSPVSSLGNSERPKNESDEPTPFGGDASRSRIICGVVEGASSCERKAGGMRDEYCTRWRSVRSEMDGSEAGSAYTSSQMRVGWKCERWDGP